MRFFLHFTYDLFRTKTERIDIKHPITTDHIIDFLINKLDKKQHQFYLRLKLDQQYVRVIRGWPIEHYDIVESTTLYVEFQDINIDHTRDSMKDNRLLSSILQRQQFALSRIQQQAEEQTRYSIISQDLSQEDELSFLSIYKLMKDNSRQNSVRDYLDFQLQLLLKQIKKGNLDGITEIIRNTPQIHQQNIRNSIIVQKESKLLNELGQNGWGAIHFAVFYQRKDIIQFLIIKNVDINKQTSDGWTPLQLSIQKANMSIFQILLRHPYLEINKNSCIGTALHLAIRLDLVDFAKILIQNKADQNIRDQYSYTAFDICTSQESKQLFKQQITEKNELIKEPKFIVGPILKVSSLINTFQERYLCCNPLDGTLKLFQSEQNFPKKPVQVVNLKQIYNIKMLRKKDMTWLMKKDYSYFQIFCSNRLIYACKNQQIAKQWVKRIFQAVAYIISGKTQAIKNIQKIVLDQKKKFKIHPQKEKIQNGNFMKKPSFSIIQRSSKNIQKRKSPNKKNYKNQEKFQDQIKKNEFLSLQNNNNIYPQNQTQKNNLSEQSNNNLLQSQEKSYNKITFTSFEILRLLGEGSFGKVFLVRYKATKQIYALKALSKTNLVKKKQLKYAVSEANILRKLNHPFIITLYCSFQTQKYLYMCIDYCARGDLSQYLAQKVILPQNQAKTIAAQILLAIENLHQYSIVYRDLKPENILLCEDGYIKIADFGLSKQNVISNTHSFCGSPAYLSPEMLNKEGFSKQSDIYGLGCILYEMLMGQPPYYNDDIDILYQNIKEGKLKFSPMISYAAKDLITLLLQRDRHKRIKINQIKNHSFFKGFNFNSLFHKQIGSIQFPRIQQSSQSSEDQKQVQLSNNKIKFIDIDQKKGSRVNHVLNFSFNRL